jgi:uncharacterized protein involved in exopolysaccharide biosynthesis
VEIVDYLRIARRRVWVLVGIPLAAAIATTLLVVLSPAQYTATATVSAPALVGGAAGNQYNGSQAVNQFVSAFQSTAQGPTVRQNVSDATHVATGKISSGLTVSQVGASSAMTLTYQSTNRKEIVPVLTGVVQQTLGSMFGSQVTLAQAQMTAAKADIASASAAIVAWEQKNNLVDPDQIYSSRIQQIQSLQAQQASLQANGKPTGSAEISAEIASLKAGLVKFAPLLAEYDGLTAARDAATTALNNAADSLSSARSQLGAADPSKVAYISGEHPVNDGSELLTKVVPVTGAAIFAAVALVTILELLARSRGTSETRTEPVAPEDERREDSEDEAADDTDDELSSPGTDGADADEDADADADADQPEPVVASDADDEAEGDADADAEDSAEDKDDEPEASSDSSDSSLATSRS